MAHPQGWEGGGRARAPENRAVILLSPAPAPSRLCGREQLRSECASGRADGPGPRRGARRVPPAGRRRRQRRAGSPWCCGPGGGAWEGGCACPQVPSKCAPAVLTREPRLRAGERAWGAGGSGCGPRGWRGGRSGTRPAARRLLLRRQLWDFVPASSKAAPAAGAGAPARRGAPGGWGGPAPAPPRPLPAPGALYMLGPRANREGAYSSRPPVLGFLLHPHP